jgi:hypothetical protein
MARNPSWSIDELVLALDLYVRRGLPSPNDSEVSDLSEVLNALHGQVKVPDAERFRNANSVLMKLANFRAHAQQGTGLTHGNRLEAEIWERFRDHQDVLAQEAARIRASVAAGVTTPTNKMTGKALIGVLKPFAPKADLDYVKNVVGGVQVAERNHETLVNAFAEWLSSRGLVPGRNVAIDLGLDNPPVIIEAEFVASWPKAIREAVGQLYEYRFFKVTGPQTRLIFLASKAVPEKWVDYLESDRGIAVAWRDGQTFVLTPAAANALGLEASLTDISG